MDRSAWRQAAVEAWYGAQSHVGQADTNPERYVEIAADAAVRVVLKRLQDVAAEDGNLDDGLWYRRFALLLEEGGR